MSRLNPLDQILPDAAPSAETGEERLSITTRLMPGQNGVLAELHRADLNGGEDRVELVRLNAAGDRSASLVLSETPDAAEARIASALIEARAPTLYVLPGGVWAPDPAMKLLAEAVSGIGPSPQDQIVLSDTHCAVLQRMSGALHVIARGEVPAAMNLDTGKLRLGGWRSLTHVALLGTRLFAAVADPVAGFDIFRADLSQDTPVFDCVITRGAHRFAVNGAVGAMAASDRGLLVGTAALAGPSQPVGDWGPELLLITPEGGWDLLVGQPRFSPQGLILPASTLMPGMGQPENAAVTAMALSGKRAVIAIQDFAGAPREDRREVSADLLDYAGALRLYASDDLEAWSPVACDLPGTLGLVSAMCLTPDAVYLGHEGLGGDVVPVQRVSLT